MASFAGYQFPFGLVAAKVAFNLRGRPVFPARSATSAIIVPSEARRFDRED
jgi:hypothetical protein